MPLSVISLASYSVGSVIDQKTISYIFQLSVGAGNYQLGGIPLDFAGLVQAPGASALSYPIDVSFKSVSSPPTVYTYKFNPLGQNVANITNLALTSNVATFTAHNLLAVGDVVVLAGLTTTTDLNGTSATVISSGLSGTAFEADITHANISTGAETGTATLVGPLGSSPLPGPNFGCFQIYSGTTEQTAGATPAGVVADDIICTARFRRG
jgi:hypothetical protein